MTLPQQREPMAPDSRFDIGPARYRRVRMDTDVPIVMSDGVTLFADVTHPVGAREALPAVINFTPYNKLFIRHAHRSVGLLETIAGRFEPSDRRRFSGRDLWRVLDGGILDVQTCNRTLVSRGYVYLAVDVRGTGTSTGSWEFFGEDEQRDYGEVLRWVREQPWCNGDLALTGISYNAIAALIAAGRRPEGLKAVFAIEAGEDPIREVGLTGGVPSGFLPPWAAAVNLAKIVPSIPGLLRAGVGGRFLRDRVTNPFSQLGRVAKVMMTASHPDGYLNDMWGGKLARFEDITAATWIHGAWHDIYNRSNIRMFERLALPAGAKQVVIDDGYHLTPGAGFGRAGNPQRLDELQCAWFDRWVKGIDNGIDGFGPITLRRQGGGGWVARSQFSDTTTDLRRLYLTPEGLAAEASEEYQRLPLPRGRVSMVSNNTAVLSMDIMTAFGRRFGSDDRKLEDAAVTFATAPLDEDLVLSGPLNLRLRVEAEGTEAFWSVTVCDVEPDGASAPLTRGALLSSMRAVNEVASRRVGGELLVAEHPLTADSVLLVTPGEPHDLDIDINPTEAVLRAGHRLRVSITRTSAPRYVLTLAMRRKIKGQTVVLDPENPSYLAFQVI